MDVEKTIEFILGMQAQFQTDLVALDTRLNRLSGTVEGLAEENRVIAAAVHRLIQVGQENRDAINEDRRRAQEIHEDVQRTTDNLNALIKVVDEMRRKNGDGHPSTSS